LTTLPPELQQFAALLDAQPGLVQTIFRYCLAMAMVEAGKARLVKSEPSEEGSMCTFETVAGDTFTVLKPPMDARTEAAMMEALREILDEEGL
jgi:hypothetical protein